MDRKHVYVSYMLVYDGEHCIPYTRILCAATLPIYDLWYTIIQNVSISVMFSESFSLIQFNVILFKNKIDYAMEDMRNH